MNDDWKQMELGKIVNDAAVVDKVVSTFPPHVTSVKTDDSAHQQITRSTVQHSTEYCTVP